MTLAQVSVCDFYPECKQSEGLRRWEIRDEKGNVTELILCPSHAGPLVELSRHGKKLRRKARGAGQEAEGLRSIRTRLLPPQD